MARQATPVRKDTRISFDCHLPCEKTASEFQLKNFPTQDLDPREALSLEILKKTAAKITEPVVLHFTKEYHRASYTSISPTRPELSAAGKTIIVTGAAGGISTAICKAFLEAGAENLIALDFNQLGLLKLKSQLKGDVSQEIHPIVLDITDVEAVQRTFDNIQLVFGKIDVLVNNAGYYSEKQPLFELNFDDWYRNFDINVKGSFIVAVEFLRYANKDAVLINLSSIVAHYGVRRGYSMYGSDYAASKTVITKVMDIIQEEVPDV